MVDDFREWISDNLRYILLGLAVVLIVVVAVVAVKFIGGLSGSTTKEKETNQGVIVETQAKTGTETEAINSGTLVKDDPEVLATLQAFYTAMSNKDVDAMKQMMESMAPNFESQVLSDQYESFNHISTYSKKGLTDGTYVVYVYYDCKLTGVDTMAPSLTYPWYLVKREDGTLYFADGDDSVKNYIKEMSAEADVQSLAAEVNKKLEAAEATDPALKNKMDELKAQAALPDSNETGVQANKVVTAIDVCNVRADSNTEAEAIGMLNIGDTVTRVQKLDNGWSEVRYHGVTGYIKSDFLSE